MTLSKIIQKKLKELKEKNLGARGHIEFHNCETWRDGNDDEWGENQALIRVDLEKSPQLKSFFSSAIKEAVKEFAEEIRLEKESFEDFLMEKHAEQAEGVLDDDMPDDFENWLIDLEIDDVMKYADEYINQAKVKLDKKISNFIK